MKKVSLLIIILFATISINAQDLISGGSNSWVFHTPDSGNNSSLFIAPGSNGSSWAWENGTEFLQDGQVNIRMLNVLNDIRFLGGNDWVLHTPGNTQGNLHFAPRKIDGSDWNWGKQIYFTKDANAIIDGKVGIGTRNPDSKLTVKGQIHCQEVLVDLAVPADYVFQKYYTGASSLKEDYIMPTLEEVETFTKENHHLPNVPSAKTIQEGGLQLKEMTNVLLQKIEELTLYTIEQEKRIKALEAQLHTSKKKK